VNNLLDKAVPFVGWVSEGYRPAPRAFAVLRIAFAIYVLIWPRDIGWIAEMARVAYAPPPGPFALLAGPPPSAVTTSLEVIRFGVALLVLVGWRTKLSSAVLSVVLVICSGLAYSYGKVDHLILFDLAPIFLGLGGWGCAYSIDSWRRKAGETCGYVIFLYGTFVAFAMFTAAAAKAATGWLNPARQATRAFVAEAAVSPRSGPLTEWFLHLDYSLIWKLLDYVTLFAEGWLVLAVFFPTLFRCGLLLMGVFHVGVWLLLGIDFHPYIFVYAVFFLVPAKSWRREFALLRTWRASRAATADGGFVGDPS